MWTKALHPRGDVVYVSSVLEGLVPIALGEVCVNEHCVDFVQQRAVHALCNSVVLRCVRGSESMLDPFVFEESNKGI